MAGNRRRKQGNSGVRAFLYVVVVLVLLGGMGYLFYYSRSQAKERQEYIRELESKEAASKGVVQATIPEEPESESETETDIQTEVETESASEQMSESVTQTQGSGEKVEENSEENAEEQDSFSAENPRIIVLNGTGKSGVAAYWRRLLQAKGLTNIVMADYKGEVKDHTVVYVTTGGDAPEGVYNLFPNAEYCEGGLDSVDPDADTNVKIPNSQKKFDSYDVWIVVGKDDALHD